MIKLSKNSTPEFVEFSDRQLWDELWKRGAILGSVNMPIDATLLRHVEGNAPVAFVMVATVVIREDKIDAGSS